jgi:transposase
VDKITRVAADLAKRLIQVHAVNGSERVVLAKAMSPQRFAAWCAQLPPGCIVAMEACPARITGAASCWPWA